MRRTPNRLPNAARLAFASGLIASLTGCGMVRSLVFVEPDAPQPRSLVTHTDTNTGATQTDYPAT